MKRILFLDDDEYRHQRIVPLLLPDRTYTAGETIEKLKAVRYDIVCLDHDLGGEVYVPSDGDRETGYTVVKWIVENRPEISLVVVHSLNQAGAAIMTTALRGAGYEAKYIPFPNLLLVTDELLSEGDADAAG